VGHDVREIAADVLASATVRMSHHDLATLLMAAGVLLLLCDRRKR
jgi:hypothetical protein